MTLEEKVARGLMKTKKTLSIAESCTGGLLSHRLTNVPGSSQFFKCGLICYSNESKSKLLRIPQSMLQKHGAVSAPVARSMAKNGRTLFRSHFCIAITGIAGPTGATPSKPVGLVYISINTFKSSICLKCHFRGTRLSIKKQAADQAFRSLLKFL